MPHTSPRLPTPAQFPPSSTLPKGPSGTPLARPSRGSDRSPAFRTTNGSSSKAMLEEEHDLSFRRKRLPSQRKHPLTRGGLDRDRLSRKKSERYKIVAPERPKTSPPPPPPPKPDGPAYTLHADAGSGMWKLRDERHGRLLNTEQAVKAVMP